MSLWEYYTVVLKVKSSIAPDKGGIDETLALAGREGWELAGSEATVTNGYTSNLILIFKRSVPEARLTPPPLVQ